MLFTLTIYRQVKLIFYFFLNKLNVNNSFSHLNRKHNFETMLLPLCCNFPIKYIFFVIFLSWKIFFKVEIVTISVFSETIFKVYKQQTVQCLKIPNFGCKINDDGLERVFLPDFGRARGCSINTFVTNQFTKSLSLNFFWKHSPANW